MVVLGKAGLNVITLFFLLLLVSPIFVFAQDEAEKSADILPATLNSYELFWPIVAGKTMGDSFYFLKSLKERVEGWIIFDPIRKSNYEVFLATKRVLEAEKLIGEGKDGLALETLDRAISHLEHSRENMEKVRLKNPGSELDSEARPRLDNLSKFIPWLASRTEGVVKDKLESLAKIVDLSY